MRSVSRRAVAARVRSVYNLLAAASCYTMSDLEQLLEETQQARCRSVFSVQWPGAAGAALPTTAAGDWGLRAFGNGSPRCSKPPSLPGHQDLGDPRRGHIAKRIGS